MRQDFYVYCWTNTLDGNRYIGKGHGTRAEDHLCLALSGNKDCPRFYNAVRAHGAEAFELGYIAQGLDDMTALRVEGAFIAMYGTMSPRGYNLTAGGDGQARSPETRARMSAAATLRYQDPEARARMSEAVSKRAPMSAATLARMSTATRAYFSDRANRDKASLANGGKPHLRDEAVARVLAGERRVLVAQELGLNTNTLKKWVRDAKRQGP